MSNIGNKFNQSTLPSSIRRLTTPKLVDEYKGVWLPGINKFLSHKWRLVTDCTYQTAVKNDDASPDSALWDYRILPFFPRVTSHHLSMLRNFLSRTCKRWTLHSSFTFLSNKYTSIYIYRLERHDFRATGGGLGGLVKSYQSDVPKELAPPACLNNILSIILIHHSYSCETFRWYRTSSFHTQLLN